VTDADARQLPSHDDEPGAANAGITGRGTLAPGQAADLVLFDPATIRERADFGHAQDQALGIKAVWGNGEKVFDEGKPLRVYSGVGISRSTMR
jgi:N-acyl-D-amino-acid deacylase